MATSSGTVLVAAPPTLHRLGLIAVLRETWPALTIRVLPDPDQLLPLLAQQRFALIRELSIGGTAANNCQLVIQRPSRKYFPMESSEGR